VKYLSKAVVGGMLFSISLFGFESSVGTTGYMRIQTSLEGDKANLCFQAPYAYSKYRLGNECESWIELGAYHDLKLDNDLAIHTQIRPIFFGPNNEALELFGWGEAYSEISGLFANGTKLWVGRRFYQRYDSHITDYFFLNSSGDGVGATDIPLYGGHFAYSFFLDRLSPTANDDDYYLQHHDIRWSYKRGEDELTLVFNYMMLSDNLNVDGIALGLLYKIGSLELGSLKGESTSAISYGDGVAKNAFQYVPNVPFQLDRENFIDTIISTGDAIESAKTWRILNHTAVENDYIGLMSNLTYEYRDEEQFDSKKQEWLSAGLRGYWFVNRNFRTVLELGYDRVDDTLSDSTYELLKTTAALELAFEKGVWQRPVLRLYYTHANWNDAAKGLIGTEEYADSTTAETIGVQLEYWW
jgi:maltoporin